MAKIIEPYAKVMWLINKMVELLFPFVVVDNPITLCGQIQLT